VASKGRRYLVGETGPEVVSTPDGDFVVGQGGPEVITMPSQAYVYPHLRRGAYGAAADRSPVAGRAAALAARSIYDAPPPAARFGGASSRLTGLGGVNVALSERSSVLDVQTNIQRLRLEIERDAELEDRYLGRSTG
jgi:hypothetical protein